MQFLAFPLAMLAPPAPAQEPAKEIVVTGRGLAPAPGERSAGVVTLDRARMIENAANRLENVLADVAGLQQFRRSDSRSANPTSQGLSLRGIGGNASSRALLILDGVPQSDPFGGWVAFPAYAVDRLGQARVTRGGGSGYHGPGALAGTIELDSAGPADLAPLAATLAAGSRASMEAGGSAVLVRSGGFASLSATYARGDGFVPTVAERRGPADRAAPYAQFSAAARGVIALAGDTELQANMSGFTDRRERGTALTANRSEGADASVRLVGRGRWGWSALAYLQTRAFASSFAGVDAGRTVATQTLDQYNTPATGAGARLELAPPLGDRLALRLGADARIVSGRTQELYSFVAGLPTRRREAGGAARTAGVFADGSVEAGALTLSLGARIDFWRIAGGVSREFPISGGAPLTNIRFADRSGEQATGRVGAAWRVGPTLSLRAAGYRGWRLPTLNELYRPFRVGADATAANAALDPERLTGAEAGVSWTPRPAISVAATLFDTRLDGAIANITAGIGPGNFPGVGFVAAGGVYRVRGNLDAIRARGIEIDAEARHGAGFARASWSHAASRVVASGAAAALDGLRPAQTPRDQLSATIGWRRGDAALSATLRRVSAQFEDDQNLRQLAPATTIDAHAAVPFTGTLAAVLRAENITDARVEAGISGAGVIERATPRTLWVGLRYGLR